MTPPNDYHQVYGIGLDPEELIELAREGDVLVDVSDRNGAMIGFEYQSADDLEDVANAMAKASVELAREAGLVRERERQEGGDR